MRQNMVKDIEKYVKSPGYFKKEDFQENIQAKLRSFEGQLIKKMRSGILDRSFIFTKIFPCRI